MKKNASTTAKRGKRNVKVPAKQARSAKPRRAARGRTEWAAVAAKSNAEIERTVANDRDAAPIFTDEMLERAKWVQPTKAVPISLRVDPDVLEFYKQGGPGYQSRMNAVLRAYVARAKQTG